VLGISAALAVAATLVADHALQQSRLPPRPLIGMPAPDFTLPDVQSGEPVSLSNFRDKPVVLIFGSYDCDVFCGEANKVEELYQAYNSRVQFLFVQVATPLGHSVRLIDPLPADSNQAAGGLGRARAVVHALHLTMPSVLDSVGRLVEKAYDAGPKRMVLVDTNGIIVADTGHGVPYGWKLSDFEKELQSLLQSGSHM
jgi:hypothetical protein